LHGPARLVGEPRLVPRAASHVDMMPTILRLAGDRRPTAALGGDLLAEPRTRPASAVAVRPGGARLDREGDTLLVDARSPAEATVRVAFPLLPPPGPPPASLFGDEEGARLYERVRTLSWLIEQDRVWDPSLLAPATASRAR